MRMVECKAEQRTSSGQPPIGMGEDIRPRRAVAQRPGMSLGQSYYQNPILRA